MTREELLSIEEQVIEMFQILRGVPILDCLEKLSDGERGTLRINLSVLSRQCERMIISLQPVQLELFSDQAP